jgi:hypothetical protein
MMMMMRRRRRIAVVVFVLEERISIDTVIQRSVPTASMDHEIFLEVPKQPKKMHDLLKLTNSCKERVFSVHNTIEPIQLAKQFSSRFQRASQTVKTSDSILGLEKPKHELH